MKQLETTFEVTQEDFIKFSLYKNWTGDHKETYRLIMTLLFVVSFVGVTIYMWEMPMTNPQNILLVIIGVCGLIYFPSFMKNNIISKARYRYTELYPKSLVETLTITPESIKVKNSIGNSTGSISTPLKDVYKIEELENLFVIYMDKETVILLSQETFHARADYDTFVNKVGEWLIEART